MSTCDLPAERVELFTEPPTMQLDPHVWDDAVHRAKIHAAFDKWFAVYERRGSRRGVGPRIKHLRTLIAQAEVRRRAQEWKHGRLAIVLPIAQAS